MGIGHDELVKRMYQHDADGDWKEFADQAVKLRWIDHVVKDVRETGVVELDAKASGPSASAEQELDGEGKPSAKLPRLLPSDHWFLHDPDGYYR
jgi:ATP-dependent Clp protease protease subunit